MDGKLSVFKWDGTACTVSFYQWPLQLSRRASSYRIVHHLFFCISISFTSISINFSELFTFHYTFRTFYPTTSLTAAGSAKLWRYKAFTPSFNKGRLVSILPSTLGGGHPDAFTAKFGSAQNVAVRAMESYGNIWVTITQMHAATAITSSAACLIARLQQVV